MGRKRIPFEKKLKRIRRDSLLNMVSDAFYLLKGEAEYLSDKLPYEELVNVLAKHYKRAKRLILRNYPNAYLNEEYEVMWELGSSKRVISFFFSEDEFGFLFYDYTQISNPMEEYDKDKTIEIEKIYRFKPNN